MKVELVSWTKNPIETCAKAASMCYASEPSRKIVKGCIKSGHLSVLEHASFTFKINGVSRSFLAQITRHRLASYSVESQRYCQYDNLKWVFPTDLMPYDDDAMYLESEMKDSCEKSLATYKELLHLGCIPDEARCVLPNATPTNMVVTMNIRSLINFFNLRLCQRASKEIRYVAYKMKKAVLTCPDLTDEDIEILDKLFVPKCESYQVAYCPEYKGCGRHKSLKELVGENDE